MKKLILLMLLLSFTSIGFAANPKVAITTDYSKQPIVIELLQDKAPVTVKNFLSYVKSGFYTGTIFHRVIDNFMIQGGGFTTSMVEKKTKAPIKNEAHNKVSNSQGTIAMARTRATDSATAQFFINVKDNTFLDYKGPANYGYAVFGRVIKGMPVINKMKSVKTGNRGMHQNVPVEAITIKSITIIK